jgi:hypothetical protein
MLGSHIGWPAVRVLTMPGRQTLVRPGQMFLMSLGRELIAAPISLLRMQVALCDVSSQDIR